MSSRILTRAEVIFKPSLVSSFLKFFNISSDYLDYDFSYSQDGNNWVSLFNNADGSKLSPESSGWTYTGVYIGLYGSSNGSTSSNYADFDLFQYKGFSE